MSNSISEIVSLSDSPENNLIAELSGGESAFLDKHCNMLIPQRYALHISSTAVKDIEEKVKNAILEWTLKLEEEGIVGENMMFTEKEKDCATNIPQTVNNYYGPTSVINSSSGNAQIVSGNGNTVSFTYDKVKDIVDEVEKSINASNLSKYDTETVIELLSDIKSKIKEEKWDSEILGLIAAIYKFAGKQELYLKQRPDELEKLVEIAKIQSTEASNAIEGIVTTNTRIKQLVEEKTTPKNRDEEEIAGYRDVLNIIHESFNAIPITQNYILQLHKILCSHMNNPLAGRTKNVQNYISATYPDGHTEVLFTPLAPFETPEALDRICEEYNRVIGNYEVEPLLAIPIFIHDFLCIHPFNDGNGRMSRLLTTLLLYRSGFYVGKYISLEAKIAKNKDLYYEALGHSQDGWHEGEEDAVPFIKYLLGTILAAYKDFEDRFEIVEEKLPAIGMVRKATQQRIGKFNKQDIRELCPALSVSSIEGSLRKLVAEGELRREGRGKSTFYVRLK